MARGHRDTNQLTSISDRPESGDQPDTKPDRPTAKVGREVAETAGTEVAGSLLLRALKGIIDLAS